MNLNKVYIIGRVTAQPEVRTTPMGDRVTTFSIATNRTWNDKSGSKKESTEFHNIVLWGKQADVAGQFLAKGSLVMIEGRLQTRKWQGKDGVTRYITEIIGERIQLGPRAANSGVKRDELAADNYNGSEDEVHPSNEVPVIELEEDGEIKPEDLPF